MYYKVGVVEQYLVLFVLNIFLILQSLDSIFFKSFKYSGNTGK